MNVIREPKKHYDVTVVGAGPAGANLARLLSGAGRSVLVVDASERRGRKVCAGLLSPDAQAVLARYDINLPSEVLASPQLFSVRTVDLGENAPQSRRYRRSYINMDRGRFDAFLRSMIPEDVDVLRGDCKAVFRARNGFSVELHTDVGAFSVTTDTVVGADGAMSTVRKCLFPTKKLKKYVAIQQWFDGGEENAYYSCIFDNETSESCSWIFFKDGRLVFGGAFLAEGCREAFEKQKEKLVRRGLVPEEILKEPLTTEACAVARPYFRRGVFLGQRGAYLVGEAAGLISPSSLEGISYALESAEALAESIRTGETPRAVTRGYRRRARHLVTKLRLKCLKRPFMYRRFLRSLILRLGVGAIREKKDGE